MHHFFAFRPQSNDGVLIVFRRVLISTSDVRFCGTGQRSAICSRRCFWSRRAALRSRFRARCGRAGLLRSRSLAVRGVILACFSRRWRLQRPLFAVGVHAQRHGGAGGDGPPPADRRGRPCRSAGASGSSATRLCGSPGFRSGTTGPVAGRDAVVRGEGLEAAGAARQCSAGPKLQ